MTERSDEIRALMQKARQALDDAELLLNHDRVEAAVNRIYYAAFDAAKAALLMKGETPSSHSGVKTRFSYHFVRTETLSREVGRTLPRQRRCAIKPTATPSKYRPPQTC